MLLLLVLGHLACHHVLLRLLLPLLVLSSLLLLHRLQTHPLLVAVCLSLLPQLLFHLLTAVHLAHIGHLLSLLDLFLHQPIVHSLRPFLVLLPLVLRNLEQLLFDLVLCLVNQLAFEALLCVLGFDPLGVGEASSVALLALVIL